MNPSLQTVLLLLTATVVLGLAFGSILPLNAEAGDAEAQATAEPDASPDSLGHVVLFGSQHSHPGDRSKHPTESGRDGVRHALEAIGAESVNMVAIEQRDLSDEDLKEAELLVIYHNKRRSNPQVRKLLSEWVEAGRPMVVVHAGLGAYSDWPEFRAWIGRYWVWSDEDGKPYPKSKHPIVSCTLSVVPDSGFEADIDGQTLPVDELFTSLAEVSPTEDWVTAESPKGHQAVMAWGSKETPNITMMNPGHNRVIWDEPAMHAMLKEVIRKAKR
ncbi:MAG: ThuA domain-containing protein [Planctomycetota bacterium]